MDISSPAEFWVAYTGCNILALVALIACIEKPFIARIAYSLFFGTACVLNAYLGFFQPEVYAALAEYAVIPIYKTFLLGWFAQHTPEITLGIATLQLWIAVSIWGRGWLFKGGAFAGIVLLLLLLPLGLGAAFPAPLNVLIGLRLLYGRRHIDYLWPVVVKEVAKTKSYAHR